jgi:hypothetical protein
MKQQFKLFLMLLLISSPIFGGGWTQKKGSGFYKLDFRYLPGKAVYNDKGEKFNLTIKDMSFGFYGEHGISDELTLTANWITFQKISVDDLAAASSESEVSGIGDAGLGIRYLVGNFGNSVLSAAGRVGIPIGETYENGELWLGTGEWNQTFGLEFGHSFYPAPAYVSAVIYYRNRNEGFSDEIKWGVEGGYSFNEVVSLIGRFHGLNTLENGIEDFIGGFAIYSNNQKYIAYGLELIYKFNSGVGLAVGYESGGAGRNIISAPVLSFGLFLAD